MYGSVTNQSASANQPLLSSESNQSVSRRRLSQWAENERAGGLQPVRGAHRSGPVLTSILEKPQSIQTVPRVTDRVEGGGVQFHDGDETKSFVYTMLNPRSQQWQATYFKWMITLVIVSDLIGFVVSTEPDLSPAQKQFFQRWEGVTSTIFLLEYLLRLLVVTEARKYRSQGWFWGRVKYARTPSAIIDFVAMFPFFLELCTGWDLPTLTYLRSFRLLRILKTSGFTDATRAVYRVIYYNRQILYVALLICIGLVILTAVLMYYLRPQNDSGSDDFKSLGSTMYLSAMMLTGQGGPDGDLPWYTKGVVLLTGIFSIGMFAIPASMLTWGFEAEAERMARFAYVQRQKLQTRSENDNWSYSSEDYSTDEEYRRIITGGDDSEDEEEAAREAFRTADVDASGNISLTEFLALSRERAAQEHPGASSSNIVSSDLEGRIKNLEQSVKENAVKLDQILSLLQKR